MSRGSAARGEEHAKVLAGAGLPPFVIDAVLGFNQAAARGYHEVNAPTVADLTGRAPVGVQAFLAAHRDALAS